MTKTIYAEYSQQKWAIRRTYVPIDSLTKRSVYSNVCNRKATLETNHAERANAPHGSDPTLNHPVRGLFSIISSLLSSVLYGACGPTDLSIGLGRFRFQTMREMC